MSFMLAPLSCCPRSCGCNTTTVVLPGSGGTAAMLGGTEAPEGVVIGALRQQYWRNNGTDIELYVKDTGDLTPYGWLMILKLQ